jgi:hypothetical protein
MQISRLVRRATTSLALLIIALLCILPAAAHAASPTQPIDLQISPLPIQLTTPPGTSIKTDLRIRNVGTDTERLQVRLLKVSEDDNGGVHLTNPGPTDEWTQWVKFDRPVFDAPSNDWQTIHMTINVPKSAAFGYYFAVEYLRASDTAAEAGKAVAHGAVATFILLNANAPGAKREAQIVTFTADHQSYEFLPATFTVKVHNTGNVHVAPTGNIFIMQGSKQIDSITVNGSGGNVLPKGSRLFSAQWSNGFPAYVAKTDANGNPLVNKKDQPEESLKWDFSHANRLRAGHYTARLVLVYDNGQRDVPIEASVQFWVIPWRVMIYAILIVVGPALLVYFFMRWRFKKRLEKERSKNHAD